MQDAVNPSPALISRFPREALCAFQAEDESQGIPTKPGDGTQGSSPSDLGAAVIAAQADAKRDVSRTGWIFFGVFFQLFAPVVAYAVPHDPPAMRLIGQTPEYTALYKETWKNRSHARRVKYAWIGVGILWAVAGGLVVVACSTGGGCAPRY